MTSQDTSIDDIVEIMAYAISGDGPLTRQGHGGFMTSTGKIESYLVTNDLKLKEMRPKHCYSMDLMDMDRLYTGDPDMLLQPPQAILGDKAEMITFTPEEHMAAWVGVRVARRIPRGVAILGKPDVVYEYHRRTIFLSGYQHYESYVIALDKRGIALPMKVAGNLTNVAENTENLCIMASVIEDACRPGAMRAKVCDDVCVTVPVPLDDYQTIFSSREGPLGFSGRRRPILHWVAQHTRRSVRQKLHGVKRHTRGVANFEMDGVSISIQPND